MIPNYNNRQVESSGVEDSTVFSISLKDSAHIMTILRDTLYSDKVLAVLREYSANAWDAHREAGKMDVPIKVKLPTLSDPTLHIQDFGPGLSHQDFKDIYTQYGASTKRASSVSVGMLGIGSKSAFAYSDSFTVISRHGGKKRTYFAVLDATEEGRFDLMDESDCRPNKTGLTIQVPVRPEDIREFTSKAQELFQHFIPRPDINTVLPPPPEKTRVLANGIVDESESRHNGGNWIAIMGCIPYPIDLDQVSGDALTEGAIGRHAHRMSGTLFFNIGEVQISASRESLKYSTHTKKNIVQRFNNLVDEYVKVTLDAIESDTISMWEKRVRAQALARYHLPVPKDRKDLTAHRVELETPKNFTFGAKGAHAGVDVSREARLLIYDDDRNRSGFQTSYHDVILYPTGYPLADPSITYEVMRTELEELVKKADIDGIPIHRLSEIPWVAPPPKNKRWRSAALPNEKHKVSTFVLNPTAAFGHPYSEAWTIEKRVPQPEDLFVTMSAFKVATPHGEGDFYYLMRGDLNTAKQFGITIPPVYGYKSTPKKPIDVSKCVGTSYLTWRKEGFLKLLLESKLANDYLQIREWARAFETAGWRSKYSLKNIIKALGKDHPVCRSLINQARAVKKSKTLTYDQQTALKNLAERCFHKDNPSEAMKARRELFGRYPLFSLPNVRVSSLYDDSGEHWINYIKMVDQLLPLGQIQIDGKTLEDPEEDNDDD